MRHAFLCLPLVCALAMAAPSSVTLISSANPAVLGQPLTLSATVTPTTATGKVTFYSGAAIVGIATLSGGQAKFTTTLLASGTSSLDAYYGGDANDAPGSSASISETVGALNGDGFQLAQTACNLCSQVPTGVIEGDFNHDGRPDVLVNTSLGYPPYTFSVLLGKGDGTFQVGATYSFGLAIAVGDFNGDGVTDVVIEGPLAGALTPISLMPGNGDGTFGAPHLIGYILPTAIVIADFNGDGKADIALAGGGIYSVLLGNGDGTFSQLPDSGQLGVQYLAVADFNGDGKPDLAFSTVTEVGIVLGQGDGTFASPIYTPSVQGGPLVIGDFNGDGKPDIATTPAFGTSALTILLGNGDGTMRVLPSYSGSFSGLAAGDFNGDGKLDLLVYTAPNLGTAGLWLGNGDGTFSLSATYSAPGYGTPIVADFNNDGRTDFLEISSGGATVFLGSATPALKLSETHSGNLSGGTGIAFTITVSNPGLASVGAATVIDTLPNSFTPTALSGAGWSCTITTLTCTRSDSLAAGASYPQITLITTANSAGPVTNMVEVLTGGLAPVLALDTFAVIEIITTQLASSTISSVVGQSVTFTATVTPPVESATVTFYDGATVLGVSTVSYTGQSMFTTNLLPAGAHHVYARLDAIGDFVSSTSNIVTETVIPAPANGFQPAVSYATQAVSQGIVLADFNGDGIPDVAAAGGGVVSVFLGNGDGTLRPAVTTNIGSYITTQLAVGDFNVDGKPDLVVALQTNSGLYGFAVLMGKGDGTFLPALTYTVPAGAGGTSSVGLVVADFNGDGMPDIAFTGSSAIYVWLGAPGGTFQTPLTYTTSNPIIYGSLVAADFNGDGKADLAYSDAAGDLDVLLGNGDGTFRLASSTVVGGGQSSLVTADFNGDGKPDLAFADGFGLYILLGNGDGTLQPAKVTNIRNYPFLLAAADLNGDGKTDVVLSRWSDTVVELLGNGDGTFQGPIVVPVGGLATAAVVSNFNGNGQADIAVANGTGVSVLIGSEFASAPRANLAVWRPSNGTWYVNQAQAAPIAQQWGLPGDSAAPADFLGDGLLDYVVWRPSLGDWYILPTAINYPNPQQWGLPGDIPVPGDYYLPGMASLAVWRPSNGTWYVNVLNAIFKSQQWGLPGDIPIVADFDGDGKTDYAVWRPSNGTWYIILSSSGAQVEKQWGLPGDLPVAADFDGDGKADYAVWRPSNGMWYVILSSTGQTFTQQWGLDGDIPVPHDYDFDGKADFAVWRPSNGTWYIVPSASPAVPLIVQWGLPGDIPIYQPPGN